MGENPSLLPDIDEPVPTEEPVAEEPPVMEEPAGEPRVEETVAETDEMTPAIPPAEPRETPFAPEETAPPETGGDFVADGWRALTKGDPRAALALWEKGIQESPDRRLAFVVSVYTLRVAALKKAREVGAERYALVVKGTYQNKPAYYLLVYPPDGQLFEVQKEVIDRLKLKALKGNRLIDLRRKIGLGSTSTAPSPPVETKPTPAPTPAPTPTPVPRSVEKKTVERQLAGRPAEEIDAASRLVQGGRYEEAVTLLEPLFATPPKEWEAYLVMGTAHLGAGRLDLAENYFNRGIARDARQAKLWIQLALVAQQKKENLAALQRLNHARQLAPESPDVWLNIGYSNDVLGDRDGAVRAYRNFLAFSEGKADYLKMRMRVIERLGALER